jgi:hypothetical protein
MPSRARNRRPDFHHESQEEHTMALNGTDRMDKEDSITTLELLCDLTQQEHTEKSEQLAKLDLAINAQKDEAREKAAGYREAIKVLVGERDKIATIVDEHKEMRMVECVVEADFARNTVTTKRRDNGEHVSERAMDAEERAALAQGDLLEEREEARA